MKRKRTLWPGSNGNGASPSSQQPKKQNLHSAPPEHDNPPRGNGAGRPPKYHETHPHRAYRLISRDGLTDNQLAIAFGVTDACIVQWKDEHPEFFSEYKRGWHDFAYGDAASKSLACRAKGYSHPEEKVFLGPGGEIITHTVMKHYPPDTAAAIFLACNWSRRMGNNDFVQTHKVEHSGSIKAEDLEMRAMMKGLLSKLGEDPEKLIALEETLERIACANSQPC